MVSSFQNGDDNVGHGVGYGPSDHLGDLQGIINSLDYIKDLGFNAIWMTPIFVSDIGDKRLASTGYYPTDYFNIDYRFGGNDKFRELVAAAHKKGIYIILDGVFGHHENPVKSSPKGNTIVNKETDNDNNRKVKYPDSLPFFKEVAQYWIEEYEIDGWRLDVAKELATEDQSGNFLFDIRRAVEEVCEKRRSEGKEWGILGYIVGEYWSSIGPINDNVYTANTDEPALRSAFDFPFRYSLVQLLAQDENGDTKTTNVLNEIADLHRFPKQKSYNRNDVYPNFFIDNHDTYRFGNLIRLRYNIGVDHDDYWKYHKLAIGILAVYSGPITLYYGDEIGDITDCWYGNEGKDCPETSVYKVEKSNCARTSGHISGFNTRQQDLHDYTKALLKARLAHPSMWRGTHGKTFQGNVYFNCKYDTVTGDKTVFIANIGKEATTVTYQVGGVKLYDFVSGEVIYSYSDGKYDIKMDALGTRVFQVYDEDIEITKPGVDCAAAVEAKSNLKNEQKESQKKLIFVAAAAGAVVIIVIVVAIIIVVRMKRKFARELEEAKSNPLVDMSLE